eukprot:GEMP01063650.1.p1 GENE.GEMP01063650.1~~GEMP01063650.1.p1  ORF type:complete len:172 (+),score=21.87 GEMP01063650.1:367-882(+)
MQHLKVLISGLWADLIIAAVCGPLHFLATDWTQLRFRVTAVKPTGAEQTTTASSGPVNWKSNLYWALYYYSVVNLCFVPWMIFDTHSMMTAYDGEEQQKRDADLSVQRRHVFRRYEPIIDLLSYRDGIPASVPHDLDAGPGLPTLWQRHAMVAFDFDSDHRSWRPTALQLG